MANTPHKHAALIKAWADGAKIEFRIPQTGDWIESAVPGWDNATIYRIKPEPKPDVVVNTLMEFTETWKSPKIRCSWNSLMPEGYRHNVGRYPQIRFTFDGETDELKSVEIIK